MRPLDVPHYDSDEGFTLVEMLIAILVGSIVMTIAISTIVTFSSSSAKIMSKREVAENTRFSMSRILKDLGSAQSLLRCTVWNSTELQVEYETYISRLENGGDDPSTQAIETGTPSFSGSSADCLEYYETGRVLNRVLPNSLCWYKDLTPESDQIDYSKAFRSACLFRGGSAMNANYNASGNDIGFNGATILPMPCSPSAGKATDDNVIYYIECEYNNANMHYFVPNETVYGWSAESSSFRVVLDLDLIDNDNVSNKENIFSYTTSSGDVPNFVNSVAGNNTADILYVNVVMNVRYDTTSNKVDGTDRNGTYKFGQTVLLQGAKTYNDEGAYGDKFTG